MILRFDDFKLDTEHYELRYHGQLRNVEPLVFNLIAHFAQHPDQVFSRDDLIEAIWSGRIVSDATVSTCVKNARKALNDSGNNPTYLKTVRGRGFRFTATVSQTTKEPTTATTRIATTEPSLLILPLRTFTDEPAINTLAASLALNLSTILTRIPLLRLSTQTSYYSAQAITPTARELHEELGIDYVLEGNVQQLVENQYRFNIQLVDAKTGFQLWAEQFTIAGSLNEALDKSVIAIIAKLEPQLHRAIYNTVRASDADPNARQLYLEAYSILALKGWHHDTFSAAGDLLRHSCKLDSEFALAAASLALVMGLGNRIGLMADPEKAKAEALAAAERSLYLDSMDSNVLGLTGCALADIGHVDRSVPILKNAIEINPANPQGWAALGSAYLLQHKIAEAIQHLSHGIHISPLDSRLSLWGSLLALSHLLTKDIQTARQQAELACQRDDRSYLPRVVLAAVQLADAQPKSALAALNEAYRIFPNLSHWQIVLLVGHKLGDDLLQLKRI